MKHTPLVNPTIKGQTTRRYGYGGGGGGDVPLYSQKNRSFHHILFRSLTVKKTSIYHSLIKLRSCLRLAFLRRVARDQYTIEIYYARGVQARIQMTTAA